MKILMFMWRDIKNPSSGGAGRATHELCKRWVKGGHQVTVFTSSFPHAKEYEKWEGYEIIRKGSLFTHYFYAPIYYKRYFKGKYQVVIDQINTIPYFTPLFVREAPIFVYIHQLCREIWFYELPPPFSLMGYLVEPFYLKLYRKYPTITVSPSTRQDLLSLGFSKVFIIPNGIDFEPLANLEEKANEPTIIFIGRLVRAKRPDHLIRAVKLIQKYVPNIKLWVIGEGYFKLPLIRLAKKLTLANNIIFWGWVEAERKLQLLKQAHCLCATSVREGWGLTVLEANGVGTPVIAYNVPGLRDAVKNGLNGMLTPQNNPHELAQCLIEFFNNPTLMKSLSENALSNSYHFNWDNTAEDFLKIMEGKIF